MKKTKAQLVSELQELRKRIRELEDSHADADKSALGALGGIENIVNRSPALVFIWRVVPGEWPVELVSENVERILGYSRDDFESGRVSWPGITHPDDVPRLEAEVAQYIEQGTDEWSQEYRLITKSGQIRWFRDQNLVLRGPSGDVSYIQSIVLDVTEQKQADEALELHGEIAANIAEGIMLTQTSDGVIVYANPTFQRMFGYQSAALIGKHVSILNAPGEEAPEEVAAGIMQSLNDHGEWRGEIHNIKADGTLFWTSVSVSTFKHTEYGPVWLTVQEDITERKLAALEAANERDLMQTLLDNVPDYIYFKDRNRRFVRVSKSFSSLFKCGLEDIIGKTDEELFPEEIAHETVPDDRSVIETGTPIINKEEGGELIEGEEHWVLTTKLPWHDQAGNIKGLFGISREITWLKSAQKALRESEEKYRRIFDSMQDVYAEVELNGTILEISPSIEAMAGYSREEMLGRSIVDLYVNPEARERLKELLYQKGFVNDYEVLLIHKDGREVPCAFSVRLVADEHNEPVKIVGTMRDVSERKLTENALRRSEQRFANMAANVQGMLYTFQMDSDGNLSLPYASEGCLRIYGVSAEKAMANIGRLMSTVPQEDQQRFRMSIMDSKESLEPWSYEGRIVAKGGKEKWVWGVSRPERIEGGKVRWDGLIVDITERKLAEDALRESEDTARALLNAPLETAILAESDGTIVALNDAAAKRLGGTPEELVGSCAFDLFPPELARSRKAQADAVVRSGEPCRFQDEREGTFFDTRLYPVVNEEGKVVRLAVFSEDVTDRKRAEEQIHTLTQQLMQAQEDERQWISHELHDQVAQDLSALKMACAALVDTHPDVPVELKQEFAKLHEILDRCIRTVRDLGYNLRVPALEQLGLIAAIHEHCEYVSERKVISVDFCPAGMDGLELDIDVATNLYRLVQEALNNVVKHAEATNATVRLVASHPKLILSIEDDGKGFDVEERQLSALKEKRLGLCTMAERVHLLKGTMKIRSVPMKGTLIRIEVPHEEASSASK